MKSRTRPRLLLLEGSAEARRYLLKREDLSLEGAAMCLLRELNRCFAAHGLEYRGQLVQAKVYDILPLGTSAGLVEFVPGAVTLGRLKRECKATGQHTQQRVLDHLRQGLTDIDNTCADLDECVHRLVASTVAYLVSNFVLGVRDGHMDNVMLLSDGTLFRVDFGHLFGDSPIGDSPVVWLPKAVKTAIGKHWHAVEQLCATALSVAAPWLALGTELQEVAWKSSFALLKKQCHCTAHEFYGAFTLRWFLALLEIDVALATSAVQYAWLLRRSGWTSFKDQLGVADSALLKTIKNVGHDFLGYTDKASTVLDPPSAGDLRLREHLCIRIDAILASQGDVADGTFTRAISSFGSLLEDVDGDIEAATRWTLAILAQCEVVPLASQMLAQDKHAQWLLPCIVTNAIGAAAIGDAFALGPLAKADVVPTSLLRDANVLLRMAALTMGERLRPLALRALLHIIGRGDPEVEAIVLGGFENEEEPDDTPGAWAPCLGPPPGEPSCKGGSAAKRLVQLSALQALQAMQEEGAQHAEEVHKLLDEDNGSLAQEALKTLCLMAPPSPRNAYKRCSTPMVGFEDKRQLESSKLAALLD